MRLQRKQIRKQVAHFLLYSLLRGIGQPAQKEDAASRLVPDHKEERAIRSENRIAPGASGRGQRRRAAAQDQMLEDLLIAPRMRLYHNTRSALHE